MGKAPREAQGVALVTGAGRRIGAAIARDLAAHGWRLAIHAHTSTHAAEQLAGAIGVSDGQARAFSADLTDPAAPAALLLQVRENLGPVSLLVNNASIFEYDDIATLSSESLDRHYAVHVRAPCLLAKTFAEDLPQDLSGLIVNIIDQRVWKPTPQFFSYTLSKSALWTATQTLAQALAPRIRVNAIGPGPTLPSTRQSPDDFQAQCAALPLQKGPALTEFGRAIKYLVESPSVTGQMIALDGGQHLAWRTPDVDGMRE